jgi:hypothetical protein
MTEHIFPPAMATGHRADAARDFPLCRAEAAGHGRPCLRCRPQKNRRLRDSRLPGYDFITIAL